MPFLTGKIVKASPEHPTRCEEEQIAYSMGSLHEHCENCYNRYCNIIQDGHSSCEMIECDLSCGQRLHACKLMEHKFICQQEKIPCPNNSFGCPLELMRSKVSSHIQLCPASIIRCVIEWNRWPMHSQEDSIKASLPLNNPHVKCKQLDVALALRDQRMLLESMKAPKRVHKIFQNSITRKYPSVPFGTRSASFDSDNPSESASLTASDDEGDAPWESCKMPPGLKSSVCSRLFKASEKLGNSHKFSTTNSYVSSSHNQHPLSGIAEEGHPVVQCSLCQKKNGLGVDEKVEACPVGLATRGDECHYYDTPVKAEDKENRLQDENSLSQKSVYQESEKSTSDPCVHSGNRFDKSLIQESQGVSENVSIDLRSRDEVNNSIKKDEDIKVSADDNLDEIYKKDIKLHELLGVSLNIECISKYIPKPLKMYTFLCANDFRRDEYSWHFKNIHNDIHCGLNGLMEQRCPLAYQGCTFSYSRLTPSLPDSRIVHSSLLESFGLLTSSDQDFKTEENTNNKLWQNDLETSSPGTESGVVTKRDSEYQRRLREATPEIVTSQKFDSKINIFPRFRKNSGCDISNCIPNCDNVMSSSLQTVPSFLSLPFEILRHVAKYLDGFSLNNLAMSCKVLHNVSCSLLTEKGMVILVWERKKLGTTVTWQISHKKWCFSTSFSPILHWKHEGQGALLEHMKVCPYYTNDRKNICTEPWQYFAMTSEFDKRTCGKEKVLEKVKENVTGFD